VGSWGEHAKLIFCFEERENVSGHSGHAWPQRVSGLSGPAVDFCVLGKNFWVIVRDHTPFNLGSSLEDLGPCSL
jgi:hypothetical protein